MTIQVFQDQVDGLARVFGLPDLLASLAGVYCECSPETLRIPTKLLHP